MVLEILYYPGRFGFTIFVHFHISLSLIIYVESLTSDQASFPGAWFLILAGSCEIFANDLGLGSCF